MEGVAGLGGACEAQVDCFDCQGCRFRWNEICVTGSCWLAGEADPADPEGDPLFGSFSVQVGVAPGVDPGSVRSIAIRVFHPRRTDGHELTCEALLADPEGSDEDVFLNRLRTLEPGISLPAGADVATLGTNRIPVGPGRLFLVRLHPQTNGGGDAMAVGCTAEVDVLEGSGQSVIVETVAG
jgi:hypothetical protein